MALKKAKIKVMHLRLGKQKAIFGLHKKLSGIHMDWVVKIGQLLLSLSILVFLHEWGHYIAARTFKVRVEKFYLFFDFLFPFPNIGKFSIFKFKRKDTEWGLGWFPLGGYVKIAGMLDESNDKEAMKLPPKPDEFRAKKPWQRLIIILGGIIVNLILGILILWMVKFTWGDKYIPLQKTPVAITDSTLKSAGFKSGDVILGYKGFRELKMDILFNRQTNIKVERNGATTDLTIPKGMIRAMVKDPSAFFAPRIPFIIEDVDLKSENLMSGLQKGDKVVAVDSIPVRFYDEFASIADTMHNKTATVLVDRNGTLVPLKLKIDENGKLGVHMLGDMDELKKAGYIDIIEVKYGFFQALGSAFHESVETIQYYVKQFGLIFDFETGAYKQVGGFAGMAKQFPSEWDWQSFWRITAFFSLVLAFMNFLPIPMLDGGYMMFILWEMITGKPPGEKFMTIANNIGFVIVIGLLVFANGNDLFKGIMGLFSK